MKKYISIILAALISISSLSGCGQTASENSDNISTDNEKKKVVTTIFPEYDWVREIAGTEKENMDLPLLLDNGVDLHSYQPTSEDMMKIADCALFIYVGGESDAWVEDALTQTESSDRKVIRLLDVLGDSVKEEEIKEGMEAEDEHEHDEEEHDEEEAEYDEHVWLSCRNASKFCQAIAEVLCEIDPENKQIYQDNAEAYEARLDELDYSYQQTVDEASGKTLLFGDRFPFRYLVDDYGLDYYAAFAGCSAETEASFETITFLSDKVDELGLSCIMTIDNSDAKVARAVIENTRDRDQKILTLDSMQAVNAERIADGTTYLSIMKANLDVLKEALQ